MWCVRWVLALVMLVGGSVTPVQAAGGYQVGFQLWRAADFEAWTKTAVTTQPDGALGDAALPEAAILPRVGRELPLSQRPANLVVEDLRRCAGDRPQSATPALL